MVKLDVPRGDYMGDKNHFQKDIRLKVEQRREKYQNSTFDIKLITDIKQETAKQNQDNISRTKSYATYYYRNKEIRWSFLASMVSRNAGWNMTDLEGEWFTKILDRKIRNHIFLTYERANWLIFSDAYPQLLVYEYSKRYGKPLFHLLPAFSVSKFIEMEWEYYWKYRNRERLIIAQIINEQNIIQKPVIEHPFYKKKVFDSFFFNFQDWLHFSSAIFPTLHGELFGFSVYNFKKLDERIELGKKLASLLFHEDHYYSFLLFSKKIEHTGSRFDYERYLHPRKYRITPFLRTTYPIITHSREGNNDWFIGLIKKKWFQPVKNENKKYDITNWYLNKQKQLQLGITLEQLLRKNKG
ncbi:DUF2515 domain-containing protein [Fredinandcohnia quinoae]|uniref:DUF2515 domain-containing protein n=1 Tax=Fredinandcohnia quinoae TaxID=2918902 RepID=A0AAW5DVN7_9BACI|nr:DUF2515 domain-containing protein [Fredinandcohnia sp. SECRCQ15]MCH1624705.1 DUF2515 domain-containing protein [Fredinandcohnia sp. SECRCQ15]